MTSASLASSSACSRAEQVLVVDGFFAVGEFGEAVVDVVEFGRGERVAEFGEACSRARRPECLPRTMSCAGTPTDAGVMIS